MTALCFCVMIVSCDKDCTEESSKTFEISGFTKIEAGDQHRITIEQGNEFSISAKGCADDIPELQMTVSNGTLKISYPSYRESRDGLDIDITMPLLNGFSFSASTKVQISGFQTAGMFTGGLSGSSQCNMSLNSDSMEHTISGQSKLTLSGTASNLKADISGQSSLEAYALTGLVKTDVIASGQSTAKVNAGDDFTADASGQSHIYYKGNPTTKNITVTGESMVTQE